MPNATGRPNGRFRGVTAPGKRGGHGEEASCDRSGPRTDRWFFCNDAEMAEPIVESREARVQQEEADFARLVRSGAQMPGDRAPADHRRLLRPALWVAVIAAIPVGGIAGLIFGVVNEPGNHDYVGRGLVTAVFAVVGAVVGATVAAAGGLALLLTKPKG